MEGAKQIFPDNIISNILSRLPVKPVLLFKLVCKLWYKLITNPKFPKMHLKHAIENNNFNLMLVEDTSFRPVFTNVCMYSIDYQSTTSVPLADKAIEIKYPFKFLDHPVEIFGSCNGLICLSPVKNLICVWNPSTNEYKVAPKPQMFEHEPLFRRLPVAFSYGFGYDSRIEDHKIVRIMSFYRVNTSEIQVCTLGSNKWVITCHIPFTVIGGDVHGVYLNGFIHWMVRDLHGRKLLLAFNVSNESFHGVPLPWEHMREVTVGSLGGSLCLLDNHFDLFYDFWVVKSYGAREAWSKLFTISKPSITLNIEFLKPLQYLKNGEFLFEADLIGEGSRVLLSYEPRNERARILRIHGTPQMVRTEPYFASLVSLNSGTYVGQEVDSKGRLHLG